MPLCETPAGFTIELLSSMCVIFSLPGSMILLQILKQNITFSPLFVKASWERWVSTCPNLVRLAQTNHCPGSATRDWSGTSQGLFQCQLYHGLAV